jgi:hypothetical protein
MIRSLAISLLVMSVMPAAAWAACGTVSRPCVSVTQRPPATPVTPTIVPRDERAAQRARLNQMLQQKAADLRANRISQQQYNADVANIQRELDAGY